MSKQAVLLLLAFGCIVIVGFLSSLQHDNFKKHRIVKAVGLSLLMPLFVVIDTAAHVALWLWSIIRLPIFFIYWAFGKEWDDPVDRYFRGPTIEEIEKYHERRGIDFVKSFRSKCEKAPKILPRPSSPTVNFR